MNISKKNTFENELVFINKNKSSDGSLSLGEATFSIDDGDEIVLTLTNDTLNAIKLDLDFWNDS